MELLKLEADRLGISLLEYVYLKELSKGNSVDIRMEYLQKLGYFNEDWMLTDLINSIDSPNDPKIKFIEIYDTYPAKVEGRALKSVSHTSKTFEYCYKKYSRYLSKNPGVYNEMLKGLKNELILRQNGGSQKFQQHIETWFNNRTWEEYADLELDVSTPLNKEEMI
jgi:hypothetical protein